MKIAIATGPLLPVPAIRGGATGRIWQGLAEAFAGQGHTVTIYACSDPDQPEREEQGGVSYIRKGGFKQSQFIAYDLLRDFHYALTLRRSLIDADICVINDFWLPFFLGYFTPNSPALVNILGRYPKFHLFLYRRVDRLIALSATVEKATVRQAPWSKPRIARIPNPIDTGAFHPGVQVSSSERAPIILYVGRVHPEKGLDLLISGFELMRKEFPDARLRIIGPWRTDEGGGGREYLRQLQGKAKGLPVEFVEPIYDTELLASKMRSCRVFCYPSLAEQGETFGVAPLEAMACGCITVVSALEVFEEFLQDGNTGYSFDHRTQDPAQSLSTVLGRALLPNTQNEMIAERAANRAGTFSYNAIADRYLNEFERLL